jgi:regulator of PEP synthase PpsR (kinase-PPPase family)
MNPNHSLPPFDRSQQQSIYIVADGTGGTAEKVVHAALVQFPGCFVNMRVFRSVSNAAEVEQVVDEAARDGAMVVATLVQPEMRLAMKRRAAEKRVRLVDLLGALLGQLGLFLQTTPAGVPNRHAVDDDYFRKVEAVEFTVKADDGKEPRLLREADIILVGVSRTSKTPLSVFLAHKGFRVSNVPVVLERPLPAQIYDCDQRCIFGLTIDGESLQDIRRQRLATMRMAGRTNYGDMDYILAELAWAEDLFRQHPQWPVIDVTRKAVEETAATIFRIMRERGIGIDMGEVGQL